LYNIDISHFNPDHYRTASGDLIYTESKLMEACLFNSTYKEVTMDILGEKEVKKSEIQKVKRRILKYNIDTNHFERQYLKRRLQKPSSRVVVHSK